MSKDYERGVEQASAIYKEVIRDYVTENDRLRELVRDMVLNMGGCALHGNPLRLREFMARARELEIEVDNGTE